MSELYTEERIEKLKEEIKYLEQKFECCSYGNEDLLKLSYLREELEKLEEE